MEETTAMNLAMEAPPPPLFEQTNVRKPEYWQFAKLIAPSPTLPPTKKQWTADDAIGIWCLRCQKALVFQKGSSQSIRYHMETKHRPELEAFREHGKPVAASPSVVRTKKRKTSAGDAVEMDVGDVDVEIKTDEPVVASVSPAASKSDWNWSKNLERRGGFWGNASWYDLHLERRMPLAKPLVEELIAALPPCDGKHVLDLLAGSGRATDALVAAYPTAFVTLVDASEERLSMARQRLRARGIHFADEQFTTAVVSPATLATASPMPVDVVVACLALHVLAEKPAHYTATTTNNGDATAAAAAAAAVDPLAAKEAVYEQLFRGVLALLKPGGHFVFGDHVGQLPLFRQLQILHRVGFEDIDCAWRQHDFFVAGARKPQPVEL